MQKKTNSNCSRLFLEVVDALLEVRLGLLRRHEDEHFPDRVVDCRRRLVQLLLCDPQVEPLLLERCLPAVCLLKQTRAFDHAALHLCGLCLSRCVRNREEGGEKFFKKQQKDVV